MTLRTVMQRSAPLHVHDTGAKVYDRFSSEPELLAIAVVDDAHQPVGIVTRLRFFLKFAARFGHDLFARRPVTYVMDADPLVVDVGLSLTELNQRVLQRNATSLLEGFIVVEGGRYVGIGDGLSLLRASTEAQLGLTRRLELALDGADAAVLEIDVAGARIFGAEAAARVYGRPLTIADLNPEAPDSIVHPEDRAAVRAAIAQTAFADRGEFSHRILREGEVRFVVVRWRAVREADGAIARIVMMASDATRSRARLRSVSAALDRAERSLSEKAALIAQLAARLGRDDLAAADADAEPGAAAEFTLSLEDQLAHRLAKVVADLHARDAALARTIEALREAQRNAEAASVAKSQFLANMSHELRTPLNAIIGYGELVLEDLQAGEVAGSASDVERILGAARRLLTLINEVLDLSKIEAGRMEVQAQSFGLMAWLDELVATTRPQAEANGNRLKLEIDPELGVAATDPFRLGQCVLNLLSNAAKFTKDGTIAVTARKTARRGEDWVEICVADTGIGISPEQLARLFRPFVQADASVTRSYGGTGLGLTITQRILQMLGGEIRVESAPGRGSTFTIAAPLRLPGSVETPEAAPASAPAGARRVVVVDDDAAARDLVRRALERVGFHVDGAGGVAAGLGLVRAVRPELVVLDINLPDATGWDLLRKLRADPDVGGVPVLVLSVDDDRTRALASGADDHKVKPADRDALTAMAIRLARTHAAQTATLARIA